ncbi:MAG: hypothetical protein ACTHME_05090 [Candidatus Nitrosocosmicus sp.]
MLAFHNDESIKNKYIQRLIEHYKADEIIKGIYWENGKGCAVGCTIHSSSHIKYEEELGIPIWLAKVEDAIFEGLPNEIAKEWPIKFLESIKVGSDLNKIKIHFLIFVIESIINKFDHKKFPKIKESIENILSFLKNNNNYSCSDYAASTAAATAAYDAAAAAAAASATATATATAAYAASYAAAASASAAAAYAATAASYAAAAAAYAATAASDNGADFFIYYAEKSSQYQKFADKLIELIKEI